MNKNTDILVLGNGQLGSAFENLTNFAVIGRNVFNYDFNQPIEKTKYKLLEIIDCYKPKVLINCIGKSDTRWCEDPKNYKEVMSVNGELPGVLSDVCRICNIKFVHVSTGCLYNDSNIPQKENDFLTAHCKYTLSKWIGEIKLHSEDLVIRPRLLFGPQSYNNNLLIKLQKFTQFTRELNSITSTSVVVNAVFELIMCDVNGPVNIACSGYCSMKQIADLILPKEEHSTISSQELYHTTNLYSVNTVMDLTKLQKYYQPPSWEEEVKRWFIQT